MVDDPPRAGNRKAVPPLRKPIQVRLPEDTYFAIARLADAEDRSLNAQIVRMLREWLAGHPNG